MNNINPIPTPNAQVSKPLIYKLRTRSSHHQIIETTYASNKPSRDQTCTSRIRGDGNFVLAKEIRKEMDELSLQYTAMGVNKFVLDKLGHGSVFARDKNNNIILTKAVNTPSITQEVGLRVIATKVISLVKKEVSSVYKSLTPVNKGTTMPPAPHAADLPSKTDSVTLPASHSLKPAEMPPAPSVTVKTQKPKEQTEIAGNRTSFNHYLSKLFRLNQMNYGSNNYFDITDIIKADKLHKIAIKVEYLTYPNYLNKKFANYYWSNGLRLSKQF